MRQMKMIVRRTRDVIPEKTKHDEDSESLSCSGTENHAIDGKGPRKKKRRHGKGKKCGS